MADQKPHERTSKTLFVRNLSFKTSQADLEKAFEDFGPIKSCFIVKQKETDKSRGLGYVVFSVREDAERAFKGVKSIEGRRIYIEYADPSQKKRRKQKGKQSEHDDSTVEAPKEVGDSPKETPISLATAVMAPAQPKQLSAKQRRHKEVSTVVITGLENEASAATIEKLVSKLNIKNVREITFPAPGREVPTALLGCKSNKDAINAAKKLNTHKNDGDINAVLLIQEGKVKKSERPLSEKKCKLIVRNLSFKCDEGNLKKAFQTFGKISEVKIPTKSNGLKYGYGFVQFSTLEEANKALKSMNAKSIMGRPVAVDWAVEREKFQHAKSQIKTDGQSPEGSDKSDDSDDEIENTEEGTVKKKQPKFKKMVVEDSDSGSAFSVDENEASDTNSDVEEDESGEEEEDNSEKDDSDDEEMSEDDDTDSEDESSDEVETKRKNYPPRPSDIGEGKTLFISNISFDSVEEDLEEIFEDFGEISLCRIVMDRGTEHSKGVAFIKFDKKEDADKCLLHSNNEQLRPGGIVLHGRKLLVRTAIEKEDAKKMAKDKEEDNTKKDSRNLWLLREGMIRAGTQAAQGLQKSDLQKREQIERSKRQKLKNPEIFISPTRLCVHNIPTTVQDGALRKIFLKAAKAKAAKIIECRIMRDMDRLNASGLGRSRGYAFVTFDKHEHALAALRDTNNSPNLFGEKKRLIVEFSLENRAALRTKQLRLERSQAKQQMFKKEKGERKFGGKKKVGVVQPPPKGTNIPKGMPSHMGPKIRHKKRAVAQVTKTQNKPQKTQNPPQKLLKRQSDSMHEEPAKKKKKSNKKSVDRVDDIDKLVAKYRRSFSQNSQKKLRKWFET